MSSLGFRTALSALSAAQQALDTIGHNLANAATPGYSRQRVLLQNRLPTLGPIGLRVGSGVEVADIDRVVDSLLEGRIRNQYGAVGYQSVLSDHLGQLETVFGEPGAGGLSAYVSSLYAEISGLTATPEDPALRTAVIQQGVSLADRFAQLGAQLRDVTANIDGAIATEVGHVNGIIESIAEINDRIASAKIGGAVPADLLDRQDLLLKDLSQRLDVQIQRSPSGKVTVAAGGNLLVSSGGRSLRLEIRGNSTRPEGIEVRVERATSGIEPRSGTLKGLLEIAQVGVEKRASAIDELARQFISNFNAVHSTGVPLDGGYAELAATNPFKDTNNSGTVLDEVLAISDLPFEVEAGSLYVNVTNENTGQVTQTRIDIDPLSTTVQDLRDALSNIPNVSSTVDTQGYLRVTASSGFRFDFSNRLPPTADQGNTFGSAVPAVPGSAQGPFALAGGDSFSVSVDGAPAQTGTFNAGAFANVAAATPQEVAAAINAQVSGAIAEVVDDRVVIRSSSPPTSPPSGTIQLTDGTGGPLATLGLSTSLVNEGIKDVQVSLSGTYSGSTSGELTFLASADGQIGVTPGLQVLVFDASGTQVGVLEVGEGYEPGSPLSVVDGVEVSFSEGDIRQTAGDRFSFELVADSDSANLLVATGLGAFFTGTDAATISVNDQLLDDPRLLAAGLNGAPGSNGNLLRLVSGREDSIAELDGLTTDLFYERIVADLAVDTARATTTQETQEVVLESLVQRRDRISGVSLDEELLLLEEFEQAYQVAARYLQTIQEVEDILANLVG